MTLYRAHIPGLWGPVRDSIHAARADLVGLQLTHTTDDGRQPRGEVVRVPSTPTHRSSP